MFRCVGALWCGVVCLGVVVCCGVVWSPSNHPAGLHAPVVVRLGALPQPADHAPGLEAPEYPYRPSWHPQNRRLWTFQTLWSFPKQPHS